VNPHALKLRRDAVAKVLELPSNPWQTLRLIAVTCVGIEIMLIVLHIVVTRLAASAGITSEDGHIGGFDLSDESTLAVWFSSFQLMLLALTCLALSWVDSANSERPGPTWTWKLAALVFFVMSVDETSGLHEIFGKGMALIFSGLPLTDRMWGMLPYALLLAVVFAAMTLRLYSRPPFLIGTLATGAAWFVGQTADQFSQSGYVPYGVTVVIEEGLEMLGATVLLVTLGALLLTLVKEHAPEAEAGVSLKRPRRVPSGAAAT